MTHKRSTSEAPQHKASMVRVGRIGIRMLAAVAIIGGSLVVSGFTDNTAALAAGESCASGVTVVVDFTDLGGKVDVACAEGNQTSGRTALLAAGFTAADSQPGFLCTINSMPDPCPETFAGSFWSYWHSTPDGEWTSYQMGSDSSAPAAGDLEGWRYNDGATPPGITPAAAFASATPEPEPEPDPTVTTYVDPDAPTTDESVTTSTTPGQQLRESQNAAITFTTIGFVVVIGGLVVLFVMRSRRRAPAVSGHRAAKVHDAAAPNAATPDPAPHEPAPHDPESRD